MVELVRMKLLKLAKPEDLSPLVGKAPWDIKFFPEPPVPQIGMTREPLFKFAVGSANIGLVSNYSGPSVTVAGVQTFRYEPWDNQPFNASLFTFWTTGTPTIFQIEQRHHLHYPTIPPEIYEKLPDWYKELLDRIDQGWPKS